MTPSEKMDKVDDLLTHVWMVRTFLKHAEETEEDEDLQKIQRMLYDYMHALGEFWQQRNADGYLQQASRKWHRLRNAKDSFSELQPEVSTHMNFQMAKRSLENAVDKIGRVLETV
jgi:tRNA U34 5-carboxymethylaminomethyl modifying GTPase MnmE/TrmE